jgi:hypothetical protein
MAARMADNGPILLKKSSSATIDLQLGLQLQTEQLLRWCRINYASQLAASVAERRAIS